MQTLLRSPLFISLQKWQKNILHNGDYFLFFQSHPVENNQFPDEKLLKRKVIKLIKKRNIYKYIFNLDIYIDCYKGNVANIRIYNHMYCSYSTFSLFLTSASLLYRHHQSFQQHIYRLHEGTLNITHIVITQHNENLTSS